MFSLSFVGGPNPRRGSKSASVFGPGGSISASGFGPGGPYLLADLDRGVQIRWDTGSKGCVQEFLKKTADVSIVMPTCLEKRADNWL